MKFSSCVLKRAGGRYERQHLSGSEGHQVDGTPCVLLHAERCVHTRCLHTSSKCFAAAGVNPFLLTAGKKKKKPKTAAPCGCHRNHLNDRPVAAYAA